MMEDKIKICSLNGQGLNQNQKRRDVIDYLRNKDYSIVCIVDTHFTKNQERMIRSEWGYQVYFNCYSSQSRGIAIFFKNNFEFTVKNVFRDLNGNVLLLDICMFNRRITLATIYGPNRDNPSFFEQLEKQLIKFGNHDIILTGDFNLLLDPVIDGLNYKHINNEHSRLKLLQIIANLNLYDVWREENNGIKCFTWKRKLASGEIQMGRLDYFLISESLTHFTREEKIIPGYRSDHSALNISLVFNKTTKSKTFWKFNSSLLKNTHYIKEIKEVIINVKKQYACTPYNLDNISSIDNDIFETTINPQLFFEMLLLEIRSKTIAFASALKKKENDRASNLEKDIAGLELIDPDKNFDLIKIKNEELKTIRENKLKGTLIRSRARWIQQGEKPSKYFCNLENRHFISKSMKSLISNSGEEITDSKLLKNEVFKFYEKLYSTREHEIKPVNLNNILTENTPKLSDEEAESLEGEINLKEAGEALNKMQNNKSPGSSGFSVEFFKFFWRDLGSFLVKSINFGFNKKELSNTQKEGVITCIPKQHKCKSYIKNWRPISLLNVSYKIASGCIANRIKSILPTIIHEDQSGFMSKRFLGDNIRLLYDILNISLKNKKPGLLLLIDFEKAFDSVAWSFIRKSLHFFNFKTQIIQWIETFYNNIKSTIIVNNSPTPWFPIERGCRQGDPISPYLFLICSEILALMIRQSETIKGYNIFDKEHKISQFADDTMLFLDGTKDSFKYCVFTILEYAKFSGLSMNFDKTKVVWFGCKNPPNTVFLPEFNFIWNPKSFSVLGVEFTIDLENITDINIRNKLTLMINEINQWSKRDLTPIGKVTVIKTLVLSKIVNLLITLPSPSSKLIKEIDNILYNFLWDGKPAKVKRTVVKHPFTKGGLGMIDIQLFDQSLKIKWIKRIFEKQSAWRSIILNICPNFANIYKCGDAYNNYLLPNLHNPFWVQVISYYYSFISNYTYKSLNELEAECFLFNNSIKIGKKPITLNVLLNNGIYQIKHLKRNGEYLTLQQINRLIDTKLNFLQYNSILSAIQKYMQNYKTLKYSTEIDNQPAFNCIMTYKKGFSNLFNQMVHDCRTITGFKKWEKHFAITTEEYIGLFKQLKYTTKDNKLHWLQYRILHNILTTNRSVSKFNHTQSHLCTFCSSHSETILHLFWECRKTHTFWNELSTLINLRTKHAHRFRFTERLILLGNCYQIKTDNVCNLIILMSKYYIYRCKVQHIELNVSAFIRELYYRYQIEKEMNNNSILFTVNWAPYLDLFKSLI